MVTADPAPLPDEPALAETILDLAPDAILVVGGGGRIVSANHRAHELFGHDDLVGSGIDELVPPEVRGRHASHRADYAGEPRTRSMGTGLDLSAVRADGSSFPVEVALAPVALGEGTGVVAIVRDVTERLATERQLREAEQELGVLADRERIARDLHDTVIQRLFAAGMTLQGAAAQAEAPTAERVRGVVDELDETIREIRQAIFRLTAHTLDRSSVRRRIVELVEDEHDVLGLEPELAFNGPLESIDDAVVDHLLPTLREALSNVARHARASRVQVALTVDAEALVLEVTDDGVGPGERHDDGHGLGNVSDRAAALGGEATLAAADPRGACLTWRVPLG